MSSTVPINGSYCTLRGQLHYDHRCRDCLPDHPSCQQTQHEEAAKSLLAGAKVSVSPNTAHPLGRYYFKKQGFVGPDSISYVKNAHSKRHFIFWPLNILRRISTCLSEHVLLATRHVYAALLLLISTAAAGALYDRGLGTENHTTTKNGKEAIPRICPFFIFLRSRRMRSAPNRGHRSLHREQIHYDGHALG